MKNHTYRIVGLGLILASGCNQILGLNQGERLPMENGGNGGGTGSTGTMSGSSSTSTGGMGGVGGGTPQCNENTPCDDQNACTSDLCNSQGMCLFSNVDGVPPSGYVDMTGDCVTQLCVTGVATTINDDLDVPNDSNECTMDVCTNGVASNPYLMAGSACGAQIELFCDGMGNCVGCNVVADCPGTDDECKTRTCNAGACGLSYSVWGTPVTMQTLGDCRVKVCDGAGATIDNNDDMDVPNDDGNVCTFDTCVGGVPKHPNVGNGTTCQVGGGNGNCSGGKCIKNLGEACTIAGECVSGYCVDGVCCNQTCDNGCQSCNLPVNKGICSNVPAGQDDVPKCVGPNQICNGSGGCKREAGQPCGMNSDCWSNLCNGGACTEKSCIGLLSTCGPLNNENCCVSSVVTGGTYNRSNDAAYPATVSDFRLDRFKITVGRFRKFVEAYPGNKPLTGAGAHPLISGSGWNTAWNASLPADQPALKAAVKCDSGYQTWTDTAATNENLPINCIDWYISFAFCAWDGGRLPTEAEWNYAAAGGSDQRQYPWSSPPSSTTIDATYAVYDCVAAGACALTFILKVGAKSPKGDGKWGQADLAGSMYEWNLDWYQTPYSNPCNNCANILNGSVRNVRGGFWNSSASNLLSSPRNFSYTPSVDYNFIGARCARTP